MTTTIDSKFISNSKRSIYYSSACKGFAQSQHISKFPFECLSNIRSLYSSEDNIKWLKGYQGTLHSISDDLIRRIHKVSPSSFTARVADFNENLSYKMQEQPGLEHLGISSNLIGDVVGSNEFLISFMSTEETIPQPAHVDFTWENLEKHGDDLDIGFFPLTKDGMFLQMWQRNDDVNVTVEGELIYIPFGRLLILSSKTIHGGGFRTTRNLSRPGNLRAHLYIAKNKANLSITQTNKYTEPGDKRHELSERYVNCPKMEKIVDLLFV